MNALHKNTFLDFLEEQVMGNHSCDLPINFSIINRKNSAPLTQPYAGNMIKVSSKACRITLDRINFGSFHVLQCLDRENFSLTIAATKKNGEKTELHGQLTWLNKKFNTDDNFLLEIKLFTSLNTKDF